MTLTHEEILDYLRRRPISAELRARIDEALNDPDSLLRHVLRGQAERAERMSNGDISWMDLDALLACCDDEEEEQAKTQLDAARIRIQELEQLCQSLKEENRSLKRKNNT